MLSYLRLAALSAFFCVLAAQAAPLQSRQAGDQQCNLDRLGIVFMTGQAQNTVNTLATLQNSTDVQTVQSGLAGAQGAIGTIVQALFAGQTAPADARTQVGGNLTTAVEALATVNATDMMVSDLVQVAQRQLNASAAFGNGVVANCK